jgi:hypothetical protein
MINKNVKHPKVFVQKIRSILMHYKKITFLLLFSTLLSQPLRPPEILNKKQEINEVVYPKGSLLEYRNGDTSSDFVIELVKGQKVNGIYFPKSTRIGYLHHIHDSPFWVLPPTECTVQGIPCAGGSSIILLDNQISAATLSQDSKIGGINFKAGNYTYFKTSVNPSYQGVLAEDQEIQGIKCAQGHKIWYQEGRVRFATLSEDQSINGIECLTNTKIEFLHNGIISEATLATAQTINGIYFNKGTLISFNNDNGIKKVKLAEDQTILGVNCAKGTFVEFYGKNQIRRATLSQEQIFDGIEGQKGSVVVFNQHGKLQEIMLSKNSSIQGISCARGTLGLFYENDNLLMATLSRDQKIQRIPFPKSTVIFLTPTGNLDQVILPVDHLVQRIPCRKDALVSFYENGMIKEATLSSDVEIQKTRCPKGTSVFFYENGALRIPAISTKQDLTDISEMTGQTLFQELQNIRDKHYFNIQYPLLIERPDRGYVLIWNTKEGPKSIHDEFSPGGPGFSKFYYKIIDVQGDKLVARDEEPLWLTNDIRDIYLNHKSCAWLDDSKLLIGSPKMTVMFADPPAYRLEKIVLNTSTGILGDLDTNGFNFHDCSLIKDRRGLIYAIEFRPDCWYDAAIGQIYPSFGNVEEVDVTEDNIVSNDNAVIRTADDNLLFCYRIRIKDPAVEWDLQGWSGLPHQIIYFLTNLYGDPVSEPVIINVLKTAFRRIPGTHLGGVYGFGFYQYAIGDLDLSQVPGGEIVLSTTGLDDQNRLCVYQIKFDAYGTLVESPGIEVVPAKPYPEADKLPVSKTLFATTFIDTIPHGAGEDKSMYRQEYVRFGFDETGNFYSDRILWKEEANK